MFEYIATDRTKITINPKMITAIKEDGKTFCKIFVVNNDAPFVVRESYEEVKKHFEHFNYQMHTVVKI